jgi:hypothetical protein
MTVIMCAVSDERSLTRLRAMPDLVDKVRQEIAARLEELRPLARDASDLQRALDALDGVASTAADDGAGGGQPVRDYSSIVRGPGGTGARYRMR